MWSDRPSAERVSRWSRVLLAARGPAIGVARRIRLPLAVSASAVRVAAALATSPGSVWLDTGPQGKQLIAWEPEVVLSARGNRAVVETATASHSLDTDGFGILEAAIEAWQGTGARLFGYLGYELGERLEPVPRAPAGDLPDLRVGLHSAWLERVDGAWELVGTSAWRDPSEIALLREQIVARIDAVPEADRTQPPNMAMPAGQPIGEPDEEDFRGAVRRTIKRIHAGEVFQTNLCRRFVAGFQWQARRDLYCRMRSANPASYGAFLDLGDHAVLSMSPECFLRLRQGGVESMPIKGTRARGADPARDATLARELMRSDKDRAELSMIVDLVRNDLGRVCEPGTITVIEHATLMRLPTLQHTVSRVGGKLRSDMSMVDLLRATFPAGSITGAPKIQAMVVARAEEPFRRGPAMGSIGWLDLDGDLELSVAIRTAVVGRGRIVYHAGCGVVADSDPGAESEETLLKARAFFEALAARPAS